MNSGWQLVLPSSTPPAHVAPPFPGTPLLFGSGEQDSLPERGSGCGLGAGRGGRALTGWRRARDGGRGAEEEVRPEPCADPIL